MTDQAALERGRLCDTATEVGPDAPTLSGSWTTAQLLAHIILRESRPDLALGLAVKPLAKRLDKATLELAATTDFETLVERVRSGPPAWNPTRISGIDMTVNLAEFFVHHEDIRRANDMGPRTDDPELDAALTAFLRRSGKVLFRRVAVGVTLQPDGEIPYHVHQPTVAGQVTIAGDIQELVLYAYGRRSVAEVSVTGPDEAQRVLAKGDLSV